MIGELAGVPLSVQCCPGRSDQVGIDELELCGCSPIDVLGCLFKVLSPRAHVLQGIWPKVSLNDSPVSGCFLSFITLLKDGPIIDAKTPLRCEGRFFRKFWRCQYLHQYDEEMPISLRHGKLQLWFSNLFPVTIVIGNFLPSSSLKGRRPLVRTLPADVPRS